LIHRKENLYRERKIDTVKGKMIQRKEKLIQRKENFAMKNLYFDILYIKVIKQSAEAFHEGIGLMELKLRSFITYAIQRADWLAFSYCRSNPHETDNAVN
jgi:hypothetical protein